MMFPKFQYVRSKARLKAVAALPCQLCGKQGETQASHSNSAIHGKGRGIKASDEFTAALCQSCHYEIDQGKNLNRDEKLAWWELAFERTEKLLNTPLNRNQSAATQGEVCGLKITVAGAGALEPALLRNL